MTMTFDKVFLVTFRKSPKGKVIYWKRYGPSIEEAIQSGTAAVLRDYPEARSISVRQVSVG